MHSKLIHGKCFKNIFFVYFIRKWSPDPNLFEIISNIMAIILVTSYIPLLCEPGQKMISQFEIFGKETSQCNWYLFPIELQRKYLIFLTDSQRSVYIYSYGNIICERETSKKVLAASDYHSIRFKN